MNRYPLCRARTSVLLWVVLLTLVTVRPASSEEITDPEEVRLQADRLDYDRSEETYRAEGGVLLRKGELTLRSDRLLYRVGSGDAEAEGGVRMEGEGATVEAERLHLDLVSGRGELTSARIFLEQSNARFFGERIERLGETRFRVDAGSFTTCPGERPDWKFTARRLDLGRQGLVEARDVLFHLKGVPVFYFPYLAYPVLIERQSGLLLPSFGHSSRRGTELSLAYYWAQARNLDATFSLDYYSSLAIGKGVEQRYFLGQENSGRLAYYHASGLAGEPDRYGIGWEHGGTLPGRIRLAADMELVSRRDYYANFGQMAGEYNRDHVQSVLLAGRNWQRNNLVGQFKYLKSLEGSSAQTLQRLPEVDFTVNPRRLADSPLFVSASLVSAHFWRREGVKGERLDLRPELRAAFHPWKLLEITPHLGYRERLYWTSNAGPGFEEQGQFDAGLRIGTRLARRFGRSEASLHHLVEPELTYRYRPSVDQSRLPSFDGDDRIGPENLLALALINRLAVPSDAEGKRELLYLRLEQTYDLRLARDEKSADGEALLPLRGEAILRLAAKTRLAVDFAYDHHDQELESFNFQLGAARGDGNALALDYRYDKSAADYLEGGVTLSWLRPLFLEYRHRYALGERSLEQFADLTYRGPCWSVSLGYRDRLDDREVMVSFNLGGLRPNEGPGGTLGRGNSGSN